MVFLEQAQVHAQQVPTLLEAGDRTPHPQPITLPQQGRVYYNLPVSQLIEHAVLRHEGRLAANGALCVETGAYTGRSPRDRFIVEEPQTAHKVDWNNLNRPIAEKHFWKIYKRVLDYLQNQDLYIFDGFVGTDPEHRFGVRVINEYAWHNLFVNQLFIRPERDDRQSFHADFTVICAPSVLGDPETEGLNSEAFVLIHLSRRIVLIGGTRYAGEMKKAVFSMLNFVLPHQGVLPMHGAANLSDEGETALFFGLSGTGKTTLSADPDRQLIGDDEHGWSESGIFNFEGGCYAKMIRLSREHEPQIWSAIRFGAVLENVILDEDGIPNYDSDRLTENTRGAYPIDHIPSSTPSGMGTHPNTIFFLTADASGTLPPIARLTREQAMYHFLSGYTSKLAGTERGIQEPQSTFSACFGQCFFPLSPTVYAEMLGDRLSQHPNTNVFLVNTGWFGGSPGVGQRISIRHTRAMISAALRGDLNDVSYTQHPIFKVWMPETVPGVPTRWLHPRQAWDNPDLYDQKARELAARFVANCEQFAGIRSEIRMAGPDPLG